MCSDKILLYEILGVWGKACQKGKDMKARFDYGASAPGVYDPMGALDRYLSDCEIDRRLLYLVQLRASQLNGCAYCLDMHWKDLRAAGEGEQRLYSLDAWRECPYYTPRERAALVWTEAVTLIRDGHVPDDIYDECRTQFTEQEISNLTLAVAAINAWNRLSIAARLVPGTYVPSNEALPA
jgi:AhpD family alkylhydroperoxidase